MSAAAIGADANITERVFYYKNNDIKEWLAQRHFDKSSLVVFDWGNTLVATGRIGYLDVYHVNKLINGLLDTGAKVIILTSNKSIFTLPSLWMQVVTIIGKDTLERMSAQFDDNTMLKDDPQNAISIEQDKEWSLPNSKINFWQRGGVFFSSSSQTIAGATLSITIGIAHLVSKAQEVANIYLFDDQPNTFLPFTLLTGPNKESFQNRYLLARMADTKLHLIETSTVETVKLLEKQISTNNQQTEKAPDESNDENTAKRVKLDLLKPFPH